MNGVVNFGRDSPIGFIDFNKAINPRLRTGSITRRSPSRRMIASSPGSSNSTGMRTAWLRPALAKIPLAPSGKSPLRLRAILSHQEGRLAIATNAGQGAVAAFSSQGVRGMKRTAKPCGPDTPTLVSTRDNAHAWRGDGGKKARFTRESAE